MWLITNRWLTWGTFEEQFRLLHDAASRRGLALERRTNDWIAAHPHDVVDAALVFDKDVRILAQLEAGGTRLINSARAIALCDDKALTYAALSSVNVPQPRTLVAPLSFTRLSAEEWEESEFFAAADALGYPLVVKHAVGSWGEGVYLVHDRGELHAACTGGVPVIVQDFISSSRGRDARLYMVGEMPVAAMERRSAPGESFRTNLASGGSATPLTPTVEMVSIARRCMDALGLDFGAVDFLFGEDGEPLVCEVNSNAQFVGLTRTTGIDVADALVEYAHRLVS